MQNQNFGPPFLAESLWEFHHPVHEKEAVNYWTVLRVVSRSLTTLSVFVYWWWIVVWVTVPYAPFFGRGLSSYLKDELAIHDNTMTLRNSLASDWTTASGRGPGKAEWSSPIRWSVDQPGQKMFIMPARSTPVVLG